MVDVRGDVLRPPHGTTPAAVKSNLTTYQAWLYNQQTSLFTWVVCLTNKTAYLSWLTDWSTNQSLHQGWLTDQHTSLSICVDWTTFLFFFFLNMHLFENFRKNTNFCQYDWQAWYYWWILGEICFYLEYIYFYRRSIKYFIKKILKM